IAGKRFGSMGIVDYARIPKRAFYWYRNEYTGVSSPPERVEGTAAAIKLTTDKTIIANDGTDDAYLLVSIMDIEGKEISNSPKVKLSIESGPGEFPTGRIITFDSKSDIEIIDGLAATEFRSFFGGETVIRATSPGLKDAVIKIKTIGLPKFVVGKTPAVTDRPYVRFTGEEAKAAATSFGLDNPTRTSSDAPQHSPRLASDGNPNSFWQAANTNLDNWWQVDLERFVDISQVKLTFPEEANFGYKIETLDANNNWKLVIDQSKTTSIDKIRIENINEKISGRFLRVTFTKLPVEKSAALSEVEVFGSLIK
ncbi:MAG TPA: discoidin domain-containing protein, partial [Flavobacterium sp.]